MDVSVSGTIDQKTYLKKFRGASAPLAPPGSAYASFTDFAELAHIHTTEFEMVLNYQ